MTQKYRFTGQVESYFPDLGATLQPGDEIDLDEAPNHPHLVPADERPKRAKTDTTKEGD